MAEKEEKGLYKAFESIKNQATTILKQTETYNLDYLEEVSGGYSSRLSAFEKILNQKISETESLINSFNEIKDKFAKLIGVELRSLYFYKSSWEGIMGGILDEIGKTRAILRELIVECNKAIGILEETVSPIPSTERDKLESLREELKDISAKVSDVNFEKNLEAAIEECEKGDYLASWLISGRVVRYIFEKISGKGIDEKMTFLKDKEIVSSDKSETINFILKTDRETRNIASHTISSFPQPKDAISLLADSLKLLELIWVKLEELSQEKQ